MSQKRSKQAQNISGKRKNSLSLQTRLVLSVLLVALVPLIIIATRDTLQTQQALTNGAETSLKSGAVQTANSVDNFIQKTLDSVAAEAQFTDLIDYLTISPAERTGTDVRERTLALLNNLSKKDSRNIISYGLVDTNGNVLLDSATDIQHNELAEGYFQQVQFSKIPIVSYVTYGEDKTTSITFASTIINNNGGYIGVLRVKYRSTVLQDVIIKSVGPSSETSVLLLDQLGIRMADSQNPALILKSVIPLNPINYSIAVNNDRFLAIPSAEQATNYPDFKLALDNALNQPFFRADITPNTPGDDTIAVAFLQTQPWTVSYSRPTSLFLADVQKQILTTIILVIATSILISIIATIAVRSLTSPIISLTKIANSISHGDLSARAEINTTDEIGLLAETFNKMSSQIQGLITGLEQRVEKRTQELDEANHRNARRARQFKAITEVARAITTVQSLNELLPQISSMVSQEFGFYHVGIFLNDTSNQYAILSAAHSPGGKKMLERGHRLKIGEQGIVGYVTETGIARIALDVGKDATYFNNPDLPETHSEMALPLKIAGNIMGALDVQSTEPNAFSSEDVETLSALADQVSLAIQNARLFEQTQKSLFEAEAMSRQYLRDSWSRVPAEQKLNGYRYTASGTLPLDAISTERANPKNDKQREVSVPIVLRGETIGTLAVQIPDQEHFKADQMDLIKAVAERVALSAENARLFEDTTRRAERERLVSDITTKIRGTNNPEEMMRIAAQEIKNALGVSRVDVVPQKLSPDKL